MPCLRLRASSPLRFPLSSSFFLCRVTKVAPRCARYLIPAISNPMVDEPGCALECRVGLDTDPVDEVGIHGFSARMHHRPQLAANMTSLAFKRAVAGVKNVTSKVGNRGTSSSRIEDTPVMIADTKQTLTKSSISGEAAGSTSATVTSDNTSRSTRHIDDASLESKNRLALSEEVSAIRLHQLAITLRPLPGGASTGGRPMLLTASRWEVRKAIMSLCATTPTMFEIEATDKSASIRISFADGAAAEDLSRKLRGVTVKIKGVKLHAFVREVSESSALCEGESWATSLFGPDVTENGREAAFDRLSPGHRPDTIVLRGIPANWLGDQGKAAYGTLAPGLEIIMNGLGTVRAVEVAHSIHGDSSTENASTGSGGGGGGSSVNASPDFDVNALLENMPKPRALGKGKKGAASARRGGVGTAGGGGAVGSSGAVAVGLNVDAWVQFTSFRGFERALKALRGRVLQKAGAELICEYKLGVDVTGYMTQDQRRKREIRRSQEAHEEERRKAAIQKARGQLVGLREGLRELASSVNEDGRAELNETVKPTLEKVQGHVEQAETLLGIRVVDEPAATMAVSRARGEIAIGRLSIRKAKEAVDRAEEEERERVKREKDKQRREVARRILAELEDSLSRGLALVAHEQDHPGIKPQADRAAELLGEVSEACSKDGGSELLKGGELILEARKATETATTRACMLQRYLKMSSRFATLRATAAAAEVAGSGHDEGKDKRSEGDREVKDSTEGSGSGGVKNGDGPSPQEGEEAPSLGVEQRAPGVDHGARTQTTLLNTQLEVASGILSQELEGLSEGEVLLISESAEEALDTADRMLETLNLVNAARHRLANAKAMLAQGDPSLKTSEGIMRLVAAAVMSSVRAQREGFDKGHLAPAVEAGAPASTGASSSALYKATERWQRAARVADSDVTAAVREVHRVEDGLRDKRQREEDERARMEAEKERRLLEEQAQRAERQARAVEKEKYERKQAEARIFAMELRRKELATQVKNKAARERLREYFIAQRRSGKRVNVDDNPPAMTRDRWTTEEGLQNNVDATTAPALLAASSGNGEASATAATDASEEAATENAAAPGSPDRWDMTDGANDLAEQGIEAVGAGLYLPSPMVSVSVSDGIGRAEGGRKRGRRMRNDEQDAEWRRHVSKRVRSTVVGEVPAGSWGEEVGDDGEGNAIPEEGNSIGDAGAPLAPEEASTGNGAQSGSLSTEVAGGTTAQKTDPSDSAETSVAAPRSTAAGGDMEAMLRKRLLASMGKSKS